VFYGRYLVAKLSVWDLHRGGAFVGEIEPNTCRHDAASFMGGRVLVFGTRLGVLDLLRRGMDGRLRYTDLGTLPAGGWRFAVTGCHSDTPLLVLVSRVVHDELEIAEWDPDRQAIIRSAVVPTALQALRQSPLPAGGTSPFDFAYAVTARAVLLLDPEGLAFGAVSRDRFELLWTRSAPIYVSYPRVLGDVVQVYHTPGGGITLFDVSAGCVLAQASPWPNLINTAPMFGGAFSAFVSPAGDFVVMSIESQRRVFLVPVTTEQAVADLTVSFGNACVVAVMPSRRVESISLDVPTCPLRGRAIVIRVNPDAL
jgi:hypothetical protein